MKVMLHRYTSLLPGDMEVVLHRYTSKLIVYLLSRRLLFDDAFGVGEALNETAFGTGLVARGKHRDT